MAISKSTTIGELLVTFPESGDWYALSWMPVISDGVS